MKNILALALLCLSTSSLAQENYISCGMSAGYQFRCAIPARTALLAAPTMKSEYRLSYQLTCNRNYPGPVPSKLEVQIVGGDKLVLNFNDSKTNEYVGIGSGELILTDSAPQELASKKFSECSLKIWDVKTLPAADIIASWLSEKASLEAQITLATAARDANATLAILEPVVAVYEKFISSVLSDEQSEVELKDAIKGLKSCANEGDDPVLCEQTIDKIASATDLFTEEEQERLSSLQKLLNRVSFDSIACPAEGDCTKALLKKYLTADDLVRLEQAKDKLSAAKGAGVKAEGFGKQLEDLKNQLLELKERSKGWVAW